jgi:hypothetical protein
MHETANVSRLVWISLLRRASTFSCLFQLLVLRLVILRDSLHSFSPRQRIPLLDLCLRQLNIYLRQLDPHPVGLLPARREEDVLMAHISRIWCWVLAVVVVHVLGSDARVGAPEGLKGLLVRRAVSGEYGFLQGCGGVDLGGGERAGHDGQCL